MKTKDFFAQCPVFTLEEFESAYHGDPVRSERGAEYLLRHYIDTKKIVRLKRGLYATVPDGISFDNFVVDPYLVIVKLADDAVISHITALAYYGQAYSVINRYIFSTSKRLPAFKYQNYEFYSVIFPALLVEKKQVMYGIKSFPRANTLIKVTTHERTLVDVLDKPDICGGWEEVWRSLESIEILDLEKVIEYVFLLGKRSTAALVGYFLEQHQKEFSVDEKYLKKIEKLCPKKPQYIDRSDKKQKYLNRWNIVVPLEIAERGWEEQW